MPIINVQISDKPYQKTDYPDQYARENSYIDEMINGYIDSDGSIRRIFGALLFKDLSVENKKVNGLYWSHRLGVLLVAVGTRLFKITDATGSSSEITGESLRDDRCIFADNGTYIVIASGGDLRYTDGTTLSAIADNDQPTAVSHVAFMDTYILCNMGNTAKFFYNTDMTTWSALAFASAEGVSDNLVALMVSNRQIYLFGQKSLEIWYNDGSTPFSRRQDFYLESGCLAKYSVVNVEGNFFWIDDKRRVISLSGSSPKVISYSIQNIINNFTDVSDAIGDNIMVGGRGFYVLHFPSQSRTFAWDYIGEYWAEWANWSDPGTNFTRWFGNCYVQCPDWNLYVVGDCTSSKVYSVSFEYNDFNGEHMRFLKRSNVIDGQTRNRKISKRLSIMAKRGFGKSEENNTLDTNQMAHMMIRWRDNNGRYGNTVFIPLGRLGEQDREVSIYRMGQYVDRQYEISITDKVPFVIYRLEEDVEVVR